MTGNGDATKEAYMRFLARNYDQCSASLHALLSSTPRGDPKIQHNVAVCEYFKGGCQDARKFLSDLDKLGKCMDRDRKIDHANSVAAVERLAAQRSRDQEYQALWLEFEGHEYVRLNQAVVHFHQREYPEAVEKLLPMFYNAKQIAPLLHCRVVLLLLSCTLAQYPKDDGSIQKRTDMLFEKLEELKPFIKKHDEDEANGVFDYPPLRLGMHALLLQAHQHAVSSDAPAALALLQEYQEKCAAGSGWWETIVYLNNLGMLHIGMGKPHLASLYLSKATELYEKSRPKPEAAQQHAAQYPSMATVYYNNGLCHMMRGKYELAYRHFIAATPQLKDTPTLWLRLAQCCIRQYEINLAAEQKKVHTERQEALCGSGQTVTVGKRNVVLLPTADILAPPSMKVEPSDDMSLVFADKCLRNAHYLLLRKYKGRRGRKEEGSSEEGHDEDDDDAGMEEADLHAAAQEDQRVAALLECVYLNIAYLSLCLSNPAVALNTAEKLLSFPALFKENRIVALSYATEAYCQLGRSEEALSLLRDTDLQDLLSADAPSALTLPCGSVETPMGGLSCIDLPAFGRSPVHIGCTQADRDKMSNRHTAALFTNLCVVHITAGKYTRAQQCLDQFKGGGQPIADLLQVYLHLAMGKKNEAIAELHERPVVPPFTAHP